MEKENLINDNNKSILLKNAWDIYNNNQNMIQFADKKVSVLLLINTIITSTLFNAFFKQLNGNNKITFLFLTYAICLGFFIFFCGGVFFPRPAKFSGEDVPKLIYFNHISKRKNPNEYYKDFLNTNIVKLLEDLIYQIYETSKIANAKYRYLYGAFISLVSQFIIFFLILYYNL